MKAIILAAGRGSRLGELTADRPKCLLELGKRTMLGWQIKMLTAAGVNAFAIVTGSCHDMVQAEVNTLAKAGVDARTLFNPFFGVADNLASCWLARGEMKGPFVLLNGDTLFEADIPRRLLAAPPADITLAVDRKAVYDADDMKVQVEGERRLVDVSKRLDPATVWGESIGMMRFSADGAAAFVAELDHIIHSPSGLKSFYLASIAALARRLMVTVQPISGLKWCEIDFPKDYDTARALTAHWD
ncbi:MAG: phosphocholine cytidylyltransferase family protein [Rhodospirillaceae bacterium]|nr:phosphocholine cytidylyltransferase family protein [Rhodospirillaceae bacterium]